MPHHVNADRSVYPVNPTAVPPTQAANHGRPRTFEDGPVTTRGLPVRTTSPPLLAERAVVPPPATAGAPDRYQAFTEAVLGLHRVLGDRFIPMCSCGLPARHCPIVKAEHDVLGVAMPFQFGPLARPLYYEV